MEDLNKMLIKWTRRKIYKLNLYSISLEFNEFNST